MTKLQTICLLGLTLLMATSLPSQAGRKSGVQLSLVPPIQLFNEIDEVVGARLGVIADNERMSGCDLSLVNMTADRFVGAEFGILNYSRMDTFGLQFGPVNHAGMIKGCQFGLVNHTRELRGVQFGVINRAGANRMLQLGVINFGENAKGWQFGLFNFNTYYNAGLPVMMIINGSF